MRRATMAAVGAVLLAVGGCADATNPGVRDWAVQAQDAIQPLPLPAGGPPGGPVQEAALAWLDELAGMAAGGVARGGPQGLASRVEAVTDDPAGAAAAAQLAAAMAAFAAQGWGAHHLAYAIEAAEPPFQATLAALQRRPGAGPVVAPAAPAAQAAGADAAPALRQALEGLRLAEEARRHAAEMARREALARVALGHALIQARQRTLGQAETERVLRAEAAELRRLARAAVPAFAPASAP